MFTFQFDSLMKMRTHIEEAKKRELGALNFKYEEEETKLVQLEVTMNEMRDTLKHLCVGRLIPTEMQAYKSYLDKQEHKRLESIKN